MVEQIPPLADKIEGGLNRCFRVGVEDATGFTRNTQVVRISARKRSLVIHLVNAKRRVSELHLVDLLTVVQKVRDEKQLKGSYPVLFRYENYSDIWPIVDVLFNADHQRVAMLGVADTLPIPDRFNAIRQSVPAHPVFSGDSWANMLVSPPAEADNSG